MTGATHKKFAIAAAFTAQAILYKNGLTQVNYYVSIPILLGAAKYGALLPDVDHTWQNVKEKTVPNFIINKLIHLTGGKHRSWQTHSIDICLISQILMWVIPEMMLSQGVIQDINFEIIRILLTGFSFGWISHIISDMLTQAGVRILCFNKTKLALVPKKLGKLRFNTGNAWEQFVYKTMSVINIVYGIFILIYPLIMGNTLTNILNTIK